MAQKATVVEGAAVVVRKAQKAYARKWSFLAVFLVVFFVTIAILTSIGFVPDPIKPKETKAPAVSVTATAEAAVESPELPTTVTIPAINLTVSVANPDTTNVALLDDALLKGAVRYPTSAKLGQDNGNVIIFGHSSYLPIVHNLAYKTFDGIQNLKQGDEITVTGSDHTYVYAVDTVRKADASQDGISLAVTGQVLTLATCDSFGTKSDRFVVTAHLVDSYPLTK